MKKFEVGKMYYQTSEFNSMRVNKDSKILIKKVSDKMISYVHIALDGHEYTLNESGRKVDVAKIQRWDNETERVHLNIGVLGETYKALNEVNA